MSDSLFYPLDITVAICVANVVDCIELDWIVVPSDKCQNWRCTAVRDIAINLFQMEHAAITDVLWLSKLAPCTQ